MVTFVLPVDDLDWTSQWLGRLRCDLLLVSIAPAGDGRPRIHIRAVESKSTSSSEEVAIRVDRDPFREGAQQVGATLEALAEVVFPADESDLVIGLRFASFIEHLASVALSELHPFDTDDIPTVTAISDLSDRSLAPEDIVLDGVVVVTQYRAAVDRAAVRVDFEGETQDWPVTLIRAGSDDLETLVGFNVGSVRVHAERAEPAEHDDVQGPDEDRTEANGESPAGVEESPEPSEAATEEIDQRRTGPVEPADRVATTRRDPTASDLQMSQDLFLACRQRGFAVSEPDPENVLVGPALLAVSMALEPGASLRPIEAALDDLAREVGVGTVSVENDPIRPFHVRFLVERREREFPDLPTESAPLVAPSNDDYLGFYLGRTLDGRDFMTYASGWPHMLIGGTTGSGKTTFIKSLLRQVNASNPSFVKVVVIDGKGEIDYFGVVEDEFFTEEFPEVKLGHQEVLGVFEWLVDVEIPRRRGIVLDRARQGGQPQTAKQQFIESQPAEEADPFPALVVLVDEFAEIMLAGGSNAQQFEQRVQQAAQTGRSVLVHIALATQRPDASVVRGAIKANLDARVALRVPTHHDSMTILGGAGAERLLGRGDFLFQAAGNPAIRLQGYRV
jgi:hypothetical protein